MVAIGAHVLHEHVHESETVVTRTQKSAEQGSAHLSRDTVSQSATTHLEIS
jgi:hypothetical protein